jgi:GTPase
MLVDETKITVKAGHGGPGKVSFFKGRQRGPDGGNGGKGGDLFLKGTRDLMALRPFTVQKIIEAQKGEAGGSNRKFGEDGKDTTIMIPVGAEIKVTGSEETHEILEQDQIILIAKGGLGGKGNYEFRSSTNTTPMYAQPGLNGEEKELEIILKLIADFGLIGLPNAGKSSLLNELTAAQVKVADYPFTTLEPNLGVIAFRHPEEVSGSIQKILADIPGLIEGASAGKGLGIKFLKHIEKTKALLHCISVENEDVVGVYETVRQELERYNPKLLEKAEIILLTKSDLVDKEQLRVKTAALRKATKRKILVVSIHDFDSLEKLKENLDN